MKIEIAELFNHLMCLSAPLAAIKRDLSNLNKNDVVDIPDELVLTKKMVVNIMERYINHEISVDELREWAQLIEGRDGIGYEDGDDKKIADALFYLSEPNLSRGINEEKIHSYIHTLSV